eukprot:g2820.t1
MRRAFEHVLREVPRLRWIVKVDGDAQRVQVGKLFHHLQAVEADGRFNVFRYAQGRGKKTQGTQVRWEGAGNELARWVEHVPYTKARGWSHYPDSLAGGCYALTNAAASRVAAAKDDLSSLEDPALGLRLDRVRETIGAQYELVDDNRS